MKAKEFSELQDLVYRYSGIKLVDGKDAMVSARLAQRLRALGLETIEAYLDYLRANEKDELVQLLNVISTNVTHFYREGKHFEELALALDGWIASGQRRVRVWCAASSTGEEPYTLAITVLEAARRHGVELDARILATDISTRVLNQASEGRYLASKVDPIPKDQLERYFQKVSGGAGEDEYQVRDSLRRLVTFKRLNLSKPPFPMRGPHDAIFCRNVMIYFDDAVRTPLVHEFRRLLKPGGLLAVGMSETLVDCVDKFDRVSPSCYRSHG